MRRKGWAVAAVAILLILGATGIAWLNPKLTHYLESERFRAELEKETAKALHFPAGHYVSIHRKGYLAAAADRFQAGTFDVAQDDTLAKVDGTCDTRLGCIHHG